MKNKDELFDEALKLIKENNMVSVSFLQRKLNIGYVRGLSIIEQMEEEKIVTKLSDGSYKLN